MSYLKRILTIKAIPSLIMLFLVTLTFYILENEFLSIENIEVILAIAPELGILVLGVTMLMIAGEFDLSVGSVFGFAPIVYDEFIEMGWNIWLALVVVLFLCAIIGAINCLITLRLDIPSFITTLGMLMVWRGVILLITQGFPPPFPKEAIPVKNVLAGEIGRIHLSLIWFAVILLVLWIVLERTRFGNWTFATGGSVGAARSMGVNPDGVKLINFMLVAFLAGISGLIQAHRLGAILPSAGEGLELRAIAASVIGGTSLAGGVGSVLGGAAGTFLILIIDNGLVMARVSGYWFRVFIGTVLIIAVVLNQLVRRRARLMR